jgi:hypothetical protein
MSNRGYPPAETGPFTCGEACTVAPEAMRKAAFPEHRNPNVNYVE